MSWIPRTRTRIVEAAVLLLSQSQISTGHAPRIFIIEVSAWQAGVEASQNLDASSRACLASVWRKLVQTLGVCTWYMSRAASKFGGDLMASPNIRTVGQSTQRANASQQELQFVMQGKNKTPGMPVKNRQS
jgi:hypothetical protein